jgi:hypothetical protein
MDVETAARWSAWPAVICYAAAWALFLWRQDRQTQTWIRLIWTAGWFALVVHVVLALAWVHGWSWSAAYEHTARRTASLFGWNWGGGVWFNLLTAGVWGADVVRMWTTRSASDSSEGWPWSAVQWYLAFMMFNATVVFGSHFAQFTGCLVCAGFAAIADFNQKRRRNA